MPEPDEVVIESTPEEEDWLREMRRRRESGQMPMMGGQDE